MGLWHLPLILSGQYAAGPYPGLSAAVFMADVVAAGYLAAYLRLSSGSVWPCVVFHGAWNAIIQGAFDRFTPTKTIWLGESGVLVAVVAWVLVALLVLGRVLVRPAIEAPPASVTRRAPDRARG